MRTYVKEQGLAAHPRYEASVSAPASLPLLYIVLAAT